LMAPATALLGTHSGSDRASAIKNQMIGVGIFS